MARRRILIFIHSLHGGGAERVAVDLAGHWVRAGHEVMILTQAEGDAYPIPEGVLRQVLGTDGRGGARGILDNVRRVRALRAVLRQFRPDIVLGMMTTSSILAVLAAWGLPIKVIATEHTHPPSQQLSGMWQRLRRLTYPRAARVVALTRGTADWIAEHVPGSRLAVIPNPVHWPLPRNEPRLRPPTLPGRHYLLAVGRLHPDKGFEVLIDAYAQLAARFPDWDLLILGEGEERARLAAQAAAHGLGERIYLPGRAGNVADWYESADLYVLSSRFEGLSNTLLEAMASGLAPVCFDCDTGPREIVRDGLDGVLVRPVSDAAAMAQALAALMQDAPARSRMAAQAQTARERFSARHVLGLWRQLFDDALEN
ncbi:glycosyltransferase family 4 protein [Bordetella avium]|uniref:glycosyltransferase family 4 protein n=1 Tax=Bordetella avium TaxID=521 RepID=UPI000E0AD94E|nr:glycosyltransferase family 4 protein [Bordetella avium]AZY51463.1 glycosyltransferase family 4 protein [Bordetella avium]RIQ14680.1 glycosyltransferase [Bordetella avium]RIQ41026.1 glycosyltransferase [Bordetella avium]RIQ46182.1 glycosyltransferase [Bordetella avium]RIQ47112.1 glycosyltransferase [Bordetella avium]